MSIKIDRAQLNKLLRSKKNAYYSCTRDLKLYLPRKNGSNSIRKVYLRQILTS